MTWQAQTMMPSVRAGPASSRSTDHEESNDDIHSAAVPASDEIFRGYLSDEPGASDTDDPEIEATGKRDGSNLHSASHADDNRRDKAEKTLTAATRKRAKRNVPANAQEAHHKERVKGLNAIEKLVDSKRYQFVAGLNGLQASRAHCIQSHLHMIIHNKCSGTEASKLAAESHGFAANWGGRLVHVWVRKWLESRELLESMKGRHVKYYTLLDDPNICMQLHSFMRSNKWSMNSKKLAKFSKGQMVPQVAEQYLRQLVHTEMPQELKKYMELELFPRIHLKVSKGISLHTTLRWLHQEGFHSQANDGRARSWLPKGEQPLKKKGVGHGMHQSDASQSLEYRKDYEGYWNSEKFVKQVSCSDSEKIISAFERKHGPGFQACIFVDHSQGHSAYAEDALLVSRMNMWPGGKQAHMQDGWFIRNGQRFTQPMNFSPDHPEYPDQLKGMKHLNSIEFFWGAVKKYLRDNCDCTFKTLQENPPKALTSMFRWLNAYRTGLDAKDAQFQVRAFSSTKYKSHQRVPETVAHQLDVL
ncbi:uncharacterized protein LAESUDRAFT_738041 [Laetiporus sulphureus 93-53]|uniref:Uncharacterized protein n=1 Tax=Laetiporus sulphureus 93-53 TaxID=1314785 RepID=A0A165D087_9APHY|nr:uncharacterized protein LAESUDRAFT_738041 [Laetiporus sulphureus 93-53]KZT03874.1 hypothetical protein LAESUDRAFT_738041 [Laetiporus sulphureus 93-53]